MDPHPDGGTATTTEGDSSSSSIEALPLGLVDRHPLKLACCWAVLFTSFAVLCIGLGGAWPIQIAPLEDLARSSNPAFLQFDGMTAFLSTLRSGKQRRRLADSSGVELQVFYHTSNGSIFDHMEAIRHFEASLVPARFCVPADPVLEPDVVCSSVFPARDTSVNHFYPSLVHENTTWLLNGKGNVRRDQSQVLGDWLRFGLGRFMSSESLKTGTYLLTRSTLQLQSIDSQALNAYVAGRVAYI
jgi:hypothetical protein